MPDKKSFDLVLGKRGSFDSDPVTDILNRARADKEIKKIGRQSEIEELEDEAKKKELKAKVEGEEKQKMAELEQENAGLQKELERKEIDIVRTELGGKIDQLKSSLESGASKKTISEQIGEIKQAAADMGLGGSKFSEIQEALALVEKLRPNKGLAEQVKEAKELLEPFQKEKTTELPAEISLKMKEMDTNFQLKLEEMKDERAARDREWQLTVKKWEDERGDKKTQTEAEIAAKREGNVLLADGVQKLAELITTIRQEPGVAGKAVSSRVIEAGIGDSGEVECDKCHNAIPIAADSAGVTCPLCGISYPIRRILKGKEVVAPKAEAPV